MSSTPDILPSSYAKSAKGSRYAADLGLWLQPIYCSNCGVHDGWGVQDLHGFAHDLCGPEKKNCIATHGPKVGAMVVPSEVYFARVVEAVEKSLGPAATIPMIIEALKNPDHTLSKLARCRYDFPEYKKAS